MFVALGLVESGRVEYALGIGADTSQGAPNDALEYSASAGGAAYLFGSEDLLADVLETYSFTSDTPDFWRREGEFYPAPRRPLHRRARLLQARADRRRGRSWRRRG